MRKDIKHTKSLLRALICGALASAPSLALADAVSSDALFKTGFTSDMAGKSIASLSTMGAAQNVAFLQGISRRQNGLHSFSKDIGKSDVFFGEAPKDGEDGMDAVMDVIGKQFGFGEGGGSAPQFWSTDFTRRGKVNAAESRETYEYDLNGFAGGLDMKLGTSWSVGLAGGYSRSSSSFESLVATNTAIDAYHTALYATYEHERATIDSVASFTLLQNDSERGFAQSSRTAEAKAKGYQLAWMLSAMGHNRLNGFALTPLAGFTFTSQVNEGMKEEGADAYNLSTDKQTRHSLKPMLGLDIAKEYRLENGMTLTPEIYGIYRYEMLDSVEDVQARLSGFDALSLSTPATRLSRHTMQVGGGISFNAGDNLTAKLSFDSDMQPGSHEHRVMFKLGAVW